MSQEAVRPRSKDICGPIGCRQTPQSPCTYGQLRCDECSRGWSPWGASAEQKPRSPRTPKQASLTGTHSFLKGPNFTQRHLILSSFMMELRERCLQNLETPEARQPPGSAMELSGSWSARPGWGLFFLGESVSNVRLILFSSVAINWEKIFQSCIIKGRHFIRV